MGLSRTWLVVVGLSGCQGETEPSGVLCVAPQEATEECPISDCAATCATRTEGVDCCIQTHGYGLEDVYYEHLVKVCEGEEECDRDRYLSEAAALCIAQVHGLGWCGGGFFEGDEDFIWSIINTLYESECAEAGMLGHNEGDRMTIDAVTGEVSGTSSIIGTFLCP